MKVSSAWGLFGEGWGSGGEGGRAVCPLLLLSQGSEHLAALDAPNPLKRDSQLWGQGQWPLIYNFKDHPQGSDTSVATEPLSNALC